MWQRRRQPPAVLPARVPIAAHGPAPRQIVEGRSGSVGLLLLRQRWRAKHTLWRGLDTPLERVAVLSAVARRLDEMADRQARVAVSAGSSYGAVGRALGVSRAAAHRRYAAARDTA